MLYRYITADVVTDFRKVSTPLISRNSSAQGEVVDSKSMKLAFFMRGEKIARQITELEDKLVKDVFFEVSISVILATTFLIVIGLLRVKQFAFNMTAQIIHLYETLYQISSDRKRKNGAVQLSFQHTSEELNELHLTFNRVARTINLATQSMSELQTEHEQAQALLSYSDAYHIYNEFDSEHSQKGVCLANIGQIMMQMDD